MAPAQPSMAPAQPSQIIFKELKLFFPEQCAAGSGIRSYQCFVPGLNSIQRGTVKTKYKTPAPPPHQHCLIGAQGWRIQERRKRKKCQPFNSTDVNYCEAQARVRQGSARDGSQGERPQSLKPSLELTLKLGCHLPTTTHHQTFIFT